MISNPMEATLIIRRIDGSELFRDVRDIRNFSEVLSYLPAADADTRQFVPDCRAVAYRFETQAYKAVVHLRIYEGTDQRCGYHICHYYDVYLHFRYSLEGRQTEFFIV